MRSLALVLLAASLLSAEGIEVRVHDIALLTTSIPDAPGDDLGTTSRESFTDQPATWQPYTTDQVVELVKREVSPESWGGDQNEIEALEGGGLCVRAPADVQQAVAGVLARLEAGIGPQVQLQARRIRISAELLARIGGAGTLDDARQKALDEAIGGKADAVLVGEQRIVAFSGQRVHVKDATEVAYLRDYECEIAQESAIADPTPAVLEEGNLLDVRPLLSPDGAWIAVELRLRTATLVQMESFDCATPLLGALQLPDVETTALLTNLVVPDRGTALVGLHLLPAEQRDKKLRYECVLVTAARVGPAPEGPPKDGSKPLRVIDCGYFVHPFADFVGPSLSLQKYTNSTTTGALIVFSADEEQARFPSDLVGLVSNQVARGTWTGDNYIEPGSCGRVLAKNTPDAMAQLDRFLADSARSLSRTVSVEVHYITVDAAGMADLTSAKGPLAGGGTSLTTEQAATLLSRAQAGEGAREIGAALACGLPGRRFSLSAIRSKAYVGDYDVEIATKAKIGDPVVDTLITGTVLDVRPQVQADGKRLLLDLIPTFAENASAMEALDTNSGDIGRVQLPSVRSQETRSTLLIDDGGWAIAGMGGRTAQGETMILLVHASASK